MAKEILIKFTNTAHLNEYGIYNELSQVYSTIKGKPLSECRKEQLFRIHERIYRAQNGLSPVKSKKNKFRDVPWYQG